MRFRRAAGRINLSSCSSGLRASFTAGLLCLILAYVSHFRIQAIFAQGNQSVGRGSPAAPVAGPVRYANTEPDVTYVGSKACAQCHPDIYSNFIKTAMGRSASAGASPSPLSLVKPVTIYVKKIDRYFQVFRKGSEIYQSEYELGPDGKEIFRDTHKIAYTIGAGATGYSYLIKRGNYLFQAPLSYYSKTKSWELSPSYESGDYGFSRPIRDACITCHSGLPQTAPGHNGLFKNPPFLQISIGCENCHGPGSLHIQSVMAGKFPAGKVDRTIVNPADLPGWLADNICMKCHQGGDERVLQPGKQFSDFRPGTPLDKTFAIFAVPFTPQRPPESPLLQHFELIEMSKCYRASGGNLHCITCHDPHRQLSATSAVAFYRQKCLTCHTEKSCSLSLTARMQQQPSDDCIGCHMPKEKLHAVSHAALTNHRIIAHQGEPFPDAVYHQTSALFPGLIHFDAIPGSQIPPDPVVALQAYAVLSDSDPGLRPRYFELASKLEKTSPDNPVVASFAARVKMRMGKTPELLDAARKDIATAVRLGTTEPPDYELYADILLQTGMPEEAIEILKRGIEFDPYYFHFYRDLAELYMGLKRFDDAAQTIRQELAIFPEDSAMRRLLSQIETRAP